LRGSEWVEGKVFKNPKNYFPSITYCKKCKHEAYYDTDFGAQLFKFCPFCGEKMKNPSGGYEREYE